jgi:hypothetical protein
LTHVSGEPVTAEKLAEIGEEEISKLAPKFKDLAYSMPKRHRNSRRSNILRNIDMTFEGRDEAQSRASLRNNNDPVAQDDDEFDDEVAEEPPKKKPCRQPRRQVAEAADDTSAMPALSNPTPRRAPSKRQRDVKVHKEYLSPYRFARRLIYNAQDVVVDDKEVNSAESAYRNPVLPSRTFAPLTNSTAPAPVIERIDTMTEVEKRVMLLQGEEMLPIPTSTTSAIATAPTHTAQNTDQLGPAQLEDAEEEELIPNPKHWIAPIPRGISADLSVGTSYGSKQFL